MVYGLSLQITDKFSYGFKDLDGDIGKVDAPDMSQDDGVTCYGGSGWLRFGRPVNPEHVPTRVLRQGPHRFMPDVLWPHSVPMVSDKVKDIIERFEPGVHQFLPVEFVWKNGSLAGNRHVLVVCHRLDTVHRELTTMGFTGRKWQPTRTTRIVFDKAKIAGRHLWRDKHWLASAVFASAALGDVLREADVTGLKFNPHEEA